MLLSRMRLVIRSIEPTVTKIIRLVGSLDCKGQGTSHSVVDVDPVVLVDEGKVTGKDLPPFGKHPHYGLIAITYIVEGKFSDWDNINGMADHFNEVGDVYAVSSGMGVVHSEKSETDGVNRAIQTIVKIPLDKLKQFPVPQVCKVKAATIPEVQLEGGSIRVLVGNMGTTSSPVKLSTLPQYLMTRVIVKPECTVQVPLPTELSQGYTYVLEGKAQVANADKTSVAGEHFVIFGNGGDLKISNPDSSNEAHVLVAAGKPLNEPWVKLLGHNGFIIAKDVKVADSVMATIDEKVNDFTYQHLDYDKLHQ